MKICGIVQSAKNIKYLNKNCKYIKSPNILIIQLKRFNIKEKFDSNFIGEKDYTLVSYPINDLDLSKYIVGPEKKNAKYDLYGVIQHTGSLNEGHYTAICKNNDNWVTYNDFKLDFTNNPVTNYAYILFYKRKVFEKKKKILLLRMIIKKE